MNVKCRKSGKFISIAIAAALIITCFITACQPLSMTATAPETAAQAALSVQVELPSLSATPAATQTASGPLSPTTGLPGNAEYRPVQVMIDNEATGRPQFGIQAADIVYEALVAGPDTRLSAIYNDTLPEKVGSVSSARVYFQMIQNEWDSIFIHDGGPYMAGFPQSFIYTPENGGDMQVRVDFTRRNDDNITWHSSLSAAYANVQAAEKKYAYTRIKRDPALKFDANADYAKYQGFSKIDIPFTGLNGDNQSEYMYDQSTGLLTRYYLGKPFVDAETNEAVTVQNVIVQYVTDNPLPSVTLSENIKFLPPDERDLIQLGMIGSGKAEFFIGGKYIKGTWEKTGMKAGTVYKLEDGSDLVLKPGNTWIELQPDSRNAVVTPAKG